ncbi:MAG: DNA-directed polymerase specialized sigma subunit, sigma24 [Planctomycetaceae bacterium]|nr:DNA-directed polymerase specialized sigma subunit, sigma24 [Planctomycetaceae bacterium]
MSTPNPDSVTNWINDLKAGDPDAARKVWERYFERLARIAHQKLGLASRRVSDEEDVALSVFDSLCRGVMNGHFPLLTDREDLWKLLHTITKQKAVDQIRHNVRHKRGGGDVRGDSAFGVPSEAETTSHVGGINGVAADELSPDFVVAMNEELERLLDGLRNETLRQVAVWRMEGYTNVEISERLGVTTRAVERKLNLIRTKWFEEMTKSHPD